MWIIHLINIIYIGISDIKFIKKSIFIGLNFAQGKFKFGEI